MRFLLLIVLVVAIVFFAGRLAQNLKAQAAQRSAVLEASL